MKLGATKASHTIAGRNAVRDIETAATKTIDYAHEGKCTAATIAYADMQRADGRAEAHARSGGQGIYVPLTRMREAAGAFNDHCVRESRGLGNDGQRRVPPPGTKREPPPVFHTRQGPPPGVPMLKGRRRR